MKNLHPIFNAVADVEIVITGLGLAFATGCACLGDFHLAAHFASEAAFTGVNALIIKHLLPCLLVIFSVFVLPHS